MLSIKHLFIESIHGISLKLNYLKEKFYILIFLIRKLGDSRLKIHMEKIAYALFLLTKKLELF